MKLSYCGGVGELIWAMTTCLPDLAFTSVKLSQSNSYPHEHHYHGLHHALRYLYKTRSDGLHFWCTSPYLAFTKVLSHHSLDMTRPEINANTTHIYSDSDWATCVKTRHSFTSICMRLASGTIAYKTRFQPTVALSSTEAESMAACDTGKMSLYIRSILWDLNIPQEAATITYKDNDACTAMTDAPKPTPRTRHMDIKYFALRDWVEQDLLHLKRIDTKNNLADPFTKVLQCATFRRHVDFILGHVPPCYSPIYSQLIGTYTDQHTDIDEYVPDSFRTPLCAATA
jgi:hypothetical protein